MLGFRREKLRNIRISAIAVFLRSTSPFHSRKLLSTGTSQKQILQEVPTVHGLPIFGTLFSLLLSGGPEKLHTYIDNRHKKFGPIFRERLGPFTSIFISDAEMVKEVFANEGKYPRHVLPEAWKLYNKTNGNRRGLYFMDGEEWLKCRKNLNRILLKDNFKIEKLEESGVLEKEFASWLTGRDNNKVVNLEENLYVLSITFMMFYLLGTPFIENRHIFVPRIQKLAFVVREIFKCSVKLSTIPAGVSKALNLGGWKRFVYAVDESVKISSDLLDDMYTMRHHDGLLQEMLDRDLSPELIRRVVIDFIIAAGDTTATTTQWTLYLLAKHKGIQDNLYTELKNDCDDRGLKNIVRETMRLYPVAPFVTRYLPNDVEVASFRIPAEELISISVYTCGRSEKYFPDAGIFKPERWTRVGNDGDVSSMNTITKFLAVNDAYASLPYAKGTRSCIGRKLADLQMMAVIKKIITSYELDVINTVDIKLNLICVPSEHIQLRLTKRS